ncbi:MAG TPA: hotdog domain-containing protein [Chthoniobacterales bacterium]
MNEYFDGFSFVDRIASIEEGVRIRGSYHIPSTIDSFPPMLVAEAIGQLAAWAAMNVVNFERRPVGGIVGSIDFLAPVRPGRTLELSAELQSVDAEAVVYDGTAHVDGIPVIRIQHCLGPMVPAGDFDDPNMLRNRFAILSGAGVAPGAFGGLPPLSFERIDGETGQRARAAFRVPASAAFFAAHFPRRPVFPGTLLLHINLELGALFAAEIPTPQNGFEWTVRTALDVKLREFIPPGETVELQVHLKKRLTDSAILAAENRVAKRVVGSGQLRLVPEARS